MLIINIINENLSIVLLNVLKRGFLLTLQGNGTQSFLITRYALYYFKITF